MATDMVNGYIYFVENTGAWVHTVDNINLAGFTGEGTDYVKLQIPQNFKLRGKTGVIVYDSGGGSSFDYRPNRRAYQMLANGVETTIANAARVVNFFMLDRHCSGDSSVFKRIYMVIKLFDGTYFPFIDDSSTERNYCKGAVLDWELDWDEDDMLRGNLRLNWRSVW